MQIEIWSDFACPWCALGMARLDAALADFEHRAAVTLVHRAFELDPRAPARREQSMAEVVQARYGMSAARVEQGHAQLRALGQAVGLDFDFDRVQLGSSFDAHRLALAARGTSCEKALVEDLFRARLSEGRVLSDPEVLRAVGSAAGMDGATVDGVLAGDAYADAVRQDEARARELGVTGVPYFLINGKWPIPGAQEVETLLAVLRRAWDRTEAA